MAIGGLWNRVSSLGRGGAVSQLQGDLRSITDAELLESPPKEVLESVTRATNVEEDRREILLHLQECLAEASSKRWRRVHGGLVLLDHLLRCGSTSVVTEIAEGKHFDPVQRLTFLEKFEYGDDRRVQNVVRQKATALRTQLITRLQDPHAVERPVQKTASSSSRGVATPGAGTGTSAGGGSSSGGRFVGFGSDGPVEADKATPATSSAYVGFGSDSCPNFDQVGKSKVVNGLVKLGHRDDTSSESENESRRKTASGSKAGQPPLPADRRKPMEDSTDSEGSGGRRRGRRKERSPRAAKPAPPPLVAEADLLGGFREPALAQVAVNPPAVQEDLLGGMFADAAPAKPPAPAGGKDLLDF